VTSFVNYRAPLGTVCNRRRLWKILPEYVEHLRGNIVACVAADRYDFGVAIDDPMEAYRLQYMQDEQKLPLAIAKRVGKLAVPDGGLVSELLLSLVDRFFDSVTTQERLDALWGLFEMQFKHLETTKANKDDLVRAMQLTFVYDWQHRDDTLRERCVKLIGNAVRSDELIDDVATFIQTLEQLNEHDIAILKILNKLMNKLDDWRSPSSTQDVWKVHPNVFIQRAPQLAVEIAKELGQGIETNLFSREEGYSICNRLQGFGLAHEVELQARELPLTNYCFRLSIQGIRLLKPLGEDVPNYERYIRPR
jgi:hypothetical protein